VGVTSTGNPSGRSRKREVKGGIKQVTNDENEKMLLLEELAGCTAFLKYLKGRRENPCSRKTAKAGRRKETQSKGGLCANREEG